MQVAVCGPACCTDDEAHAAFVVGRELARHGATVFCGGGTGVMAAVAAGARSLGGLVVAIRPDRDNHVGPGGESAVVASNLGEARNAVLVCSAQAVIIVGGSWGTLSELALAMRLAQDRPEGSLPVVTLGGWQVLDSDGVPVPGPITARTAQEAVALALSALGEPLLPADPVGAKHH